MKDGDIPDLPDTFPSVIVAITQEATKQAMDAYKEEILLFLNDYPLPRIFITSIKTGFDMELDWRGIKDIDFWLEEEKNAICFYGHGIEIVGYFKELNN
jgi:hypothetical protein